MLIKTKPKIKIIVSLIFLFFVFSSCALYIAYSSIIVNTIRNNPSPLTGLFLQKSSYFFMLAVFLSFATAIFLVSTLKSVSELEKRASEADRAKSEFVSMVSHQLRTPLSNVNWYSEMLLDGDVGELNKGQRSYIEEIYSSSQRMVELVNALLNVDLGSFAVEPEQINLNEIADDSLSDLASLIKNKRIELKKEYDQDNFPVNADPRLLRIVFQNLLSNSVKYTPEGGRVTIKIFRRDRDYCVAIADSGYGIPTAEQEKIFTRLFRATNIIQKNQGTGLGLYIAKAVMDQSGGKIWFESRENQGTTFYFTVPVSGMKKKKGKRALTNV